MTAPTDAERRERDRIARRLAATGFALPGTLLERYKACGKDGCRRQDDPPRLHGPYHQWTRKIDGKTVTRNLTDQQATDYGPAGSTRHDSHATFSTTSERSRYASTNATRPHHEAPT